MHFKSLNLTLVYPILINISVNYLGSPVSVGDTYGSRYIVGVPL